MIIADDDHIIATGLTSTLKALGHDVVGAAPNGQAAIDMVKQSPVDMAILDIRMPVMDGLEAAGILWRESEIPTIIVSAYSDEVYLSETGERGVFAFLLKPVTPDGLRAAISVAWARALKEKEQAGRVGQLEQTLKNRQTVERAKWRLVESLGIGEPEAHSRMQKVARDQRVPLIEIAMRVIEDDGPTMKLVTNRA
ncbi:MAG: response regulator [Phycisphaerales bacterium]|nr:response regulator [Phycisphaerales bacterium]